MPRKVPSAGDRNEAEDDYKRPSRVGISSEMPAESRMRIILSNKLEHLSNILKCCFREKWKCCMRVSESKFIVRALLMKAHLSPCASINERNKVDILCDHANTLTLRDSIHHVYSTAAVPKVSWHNRLRSMPYDRFKY